MMTSHIAPPPDTMQAMVLTEFGGPEVLHAAELPTPVPAADEVLVEIACTSVNPADWKTREGKLSAYIDYHFPFVLGFDLAGVIAAVGPGVTRWQVGDQVFGMSNQRNGNDGTTPNTASHRPSCSRHCPPAGATSTPRDCRWRAAPPTAAWSTPAGCRTASPC